MKLNFKKLFVITIIGAGIFISQQLHAFMGYDYYMDPTNLPSDMLRKIFYSKLLITTTKFLIIVIKQTSIYHYCHQLYFL